jgi:hypothetical protein
LCGSGKFCASVARMLWTRTSLVWYERWSEVLALMGIQKVSAH